MCEDGLGFFFSFAAAAGQVKWADFFFICFSGFSSESRPVLFVKSGG